MLEEACSRSCSWNSEGFGAVPQKFQDDPQVVYCRALAEKGSKVVCVEDGLPTWVAEARAALSTSSTWHGCSCYRSSS